MAIYPCDAERLIQYLGVEAVLRGGRESETF